MRGPCGGGGGARKWTTERALWLAWLCRQRLASYSLLPPLPQEVLRPLQLSLDTKSDRLKGRALAITQSLIANQALPAEASDPVIAMLAKVDKNTDETVQLKTLQTALTLLQSPLRPASEDAIGAVLGVCLRLTSKKGHKDAVLTTAAATVRQAVALVLSYVDVDAVLQSQQQQQQQQQAGAGEGGGGEGGALPSEAASAALKLIEDLCNIASGMHAPQGLLSALQDPCSQIHRSTLWTSRSPEPTSADAVVAPPRPLPSCAGAPPQWLRSPSLPRTFVLELLDFVLANSPAVFRRLPPFQALLSARMTQLFQAQLQDHLDAGAASAAFATQNFATFRALLRLARTLLRSYYPLLGPWAGMLVQSLLAGAQPRGVVR